MEIRAESGERAAAGEYGEIVVKGPNVMQGYLNRPEATAESIRGGWLHTGDIGYVDEDGYFFIVDGSKDMIIRGGENIYPREIEEVIYAFEGVQEWAVIGVPDEFRGEEVLAIVQPKAGITLDLDALAERLSRASSCHGGSRFAVSFRRRRRERSARALCVNSSGAGRPPPEPLRNRRHRHDAGASEGLR